jgi:hypothetical protein
MQTNISDRSEKLRIHTSTTRCMKEKLLTRIAAPAAVSSCSTFTPSTSYKKCTKQPPQLSEQKELVWMLRKSASNIPKSMWNH